MFDRDRMSTQRDYPAGGVVWALPLMPGLTSDTTILEAWSGGGERLRFLHDGVGWSCSGVEPSAAAVMFAKDMDVNSIRGTADRIPFSDASFDVVVFRFCL